MKNVTFVVEQGKPDSTGDIILPSAIKDLPKPVLLTREFDHKNALGTVEVFLDGEAIKATGDVPEELMDAFPAVGIQIIQSEENEHGGLTIKEAKLHYVGLSRHPNKDRSIKTIREQRGTV